MPALNVIENNDRIIEINHHLVHLNTHHYNDWINPRDLLNNFLYHHGSPAGPAGHHPGSPTQAGHHSFSHINDTHLGNTTPVLPPHPGHPGVVDETEEESLIVVYALFLPLLAALIFILIVALYVRRMRRSTSMQNVTLQNEAYEFSLQQLKSHSRNSSNNNNSRVKDTTLNSSSSPKGTKKNNNDKSSSNKESSQNNKMLTRSKSSSGILNNHHQHIEGKGASQQQQNNEQIYKRWNNSGFLVSTTNSGFEEELEESDVLDGPEIIPYNNSQETYADVEFTVMEETTAGPQGRKSLKNFSGRIINVLNVPKRIKQNSQEKKRFNIYTIPIETREQLKQIYVY